MNSREQVLQVDTERRRIMIDAAQSTLDHLLAKELTWAHTSDSLESKAEFIETINEYKAIYEVLEIEQNQVRDVSGASIHSEILRNLRKNNATT